MLVSFLSLKWVMNVCVDSLSAAAAAAAVVVVVGESLLSHHRERASVCRCISSQPRVPSFLLMQERRRDAASELEERDGKHRERSSRGGVYARANGKLNSTLARLLLRMHGRRKLVSRLEDIKDASLASPLHERLWRRRWCVPAKERQNRRPDARSKSSCCSHACSPHRSSLVITL